MTEENTTASGESVGDKNDSTYAYLLIIVTIALVIAAYCYWRYKRQFSSTARWNSQFQPPAEREIYFEARENCDFDDLNQLEELKKLLMRRAIATIPIVLALQNEGNSIERLYKRGMLTDDMHYKVKEMKAFIDQEIQDVQLEATDLLEEWGDHIWPQAFHFHQMIQKHSAEKVDEVKNVEEEKKQVAADKRKEKLKKQKEVSAARKKEQTAEKIAQELIQEEQKDVASKPKTK